MADLCACATGIPPSHLGGGGAYIITCRRLFSSNAVMAQGGRENRPSAMNDSDRKCVLCESKGSTMKLDKCVEQHRLCRNCLEGNAKRFKGAIYTCPVCFRPKVESSPIWIFADNSNIWIGAMKHAAVANKFRCEQDHRVRIDYHELPQIVSQGREVRKATLYGSVPPPVDTFWERVKRYDWDVKTKVRSVVTGKEKEVDAQIVADVTEVVCSSSQPQGTIIIISGDRDMQPAVEKTLEHGWRIEMYIWKNATSLRNHLDSYNKKYPDMVSCKFIDDLEERVTFLNRERSATALDEVENYSAVITLKEGHDPKSIAQNEKWWNRLEKISKWPVEYWILPEEEREKFKRLLLVFQGMEKDSLNKLIGDIDDQKFLPCVSECDPCSSKTKRYKKSDGFTKIVRGIKLSNSSAPKTSATLPTSPLTSSPKREDTKLSRLCCSAKNCENGLRCSYLHTVDEKEYFTTKGTRPNRKTKQCKFHPDCKKEEMCEYAHEESERWCTNCHDYGHFMKDCKLQPCSHLRHSK